MQLKALSSSGSGTTSCGTSHSARSSAVRPSVRSAFSSSMMRVLSPESASRPASSVALLSTSSLSEHEWGSLSAQEVLSAAAPRVCLLRFPKQVELRACKLLRQLIKWDITRWWHLLITKMVESLQAQLVNAFDNSVLKPHKANVLLSSKMHI